MPEQIEVSVQERRIHVLAEGHHMVFAVRSRPAGKWSLAWQDADGDVERPPLSLRQLAMIRAERAARTAGLIH